MQRYHAARVHHRPGPMSDGGANNIVRLLRGQQHEANDGGRRVFEVRVVSIEGQKITLLAPFRTTGQG
jgi:hypothetical protein